MSAAAEESTPGLPAAQEWLASFRALVRKPNAWGFFLVWLGATVAGFVWLKDATGMFGWQLPANAATLWLLVTGAFGLGVFATALLNRPSPLRKQVDYVPANRVLKPFREADAAVFADLEREYVLDTLVWALEGDEFWLGKLSSRSGYGKTSLLRAGLLPRLSAPRHATMRCVYILCTERSPLLALRLALARAFQLPPAQLHAAPTLLALLAEVPEADRRPVVLLFDQFEQYFLHLKSPLADDAFVRDLKEWYAQRKAWQVKIVFSLRNDYLDELDKLLSS